MRRQDVQKFEAFSCSLHSPFQKISFSRANVRGASFAVQGKIYDFPSGVVPYTTLWLFSFKRAQKVGVFPPFPPLHIFPRFDLSKTVNFPSPSKGDNLWKEVFGVPVWVCVSPICILCMVSSKSLQRNLLFLSRNSATVSKQLLSEQLLFRARRSSLISKPLRGGSFQWSSTAAVSGALVECFY